MGISHSLAKEGPNIRSPSNILNPAAAAKDVCRTVNNQKYSPLLPPDAWPMEFSLLEEDRFNDIHRLADHQRYNIGIGSRAGLPIIGRNLIVDRIFIQKLGQGWRHNRAVGILFSCHHYHGMFQASGGVCLVLSWR
jgi:hypothetical protein